MQIDLFGSLDKFTGRADWFAGPAWPGSYRLGHGVDGARWPNLWPAGQNRRAVPWLGRGHGRRQWPVEHPAPAACGPGEVRRHAQGTVLVLSECLLSVGEELWSLEASSTAAGRRGRRCGHPAGEQGCPWDGSRCRQGRRRRAGRRACLGTMVVVAVW